MIDKESERKKIACAIQVAKELRVTNGFNSAYVAGSLTAGLGNATSDADLFILSTSDSVMSEPTQFEQDGERVDVEWITLNDAHRNLGHLENFTLSSQSLAGLWPLFPTLDWCVRLLSSLEAITSRDLRNIQQRACAIKSKVANLIMARWSLGYCSSLEDFVGAEREQDYDTASYSASALCVSAAKAYVASLDDLYMGHKWVYKQLRRSAPALRLDRFAYYARGKWTAEESEGAHHLMLYGQTLLGAAALNRQLASPLARLPLAFRADGPRRISDRIPVSMDSKVLLHHEVHGQVLVSLKVALIWLWCTGRPQNELINDVCATAAEVGINIVATEVPNIVTRLVEHGLVTAG